MIFGAELSGLCSNVDFSGLWPCLTPLSSSLSPSFILALLPISILLPHPHYCLSPRPFLTIALFVSFLLVLFVAVTFLIWSLWGSIGSHGIHSFTWGLVVWWLCCPVFCCHGGCVALLWWLYCYGGGWVFIVVVRLLVWWWGCHCGSWVALVVVLSW